MSKKGIYRIDTYYGGDIKGIFIETESNIKSLPGFKVYFGEILGKHSEVEFVIEKRDLKLVTNEPEAIKIFEKYNLATGINPFECVTDEYQNDAWIKHKNQGV